MDENLAQWFPGWSFDVLIDMDSFRPLHYFDGYLPIEDHGLIGDGATAALTGRDGTIWWMCVPRFDSAPLFDSMIDARRGSRFTIMPDNPVGSRQFYLPDSGVVVTEIRSQSGIVSLTDALVLREGMDLTGDSETAGHELIRYAVVLDGEVDLNVDIKFAPGTQVKRNGEGFRIRPSGLPWPEVRLITSIPLSNLDAKVHLSSGERMSFALNWGGNDGHLTVNVEEALKHTLIAWRRWIRGFHYGGPQEPIVRRSAITLKLLDYFKSGAIVAAPTSSLPEDLGGRRNWDYRYSWIRDAAFSVYALDRIGFSSEARWFLKWALEADRKSTRLNSSHLGIS